MLMRARVVAVAVAGLALAGCGTETDPAEDAQPLPSNEQAATSEAKAQSKPSSGQQTEKPIPAALTFTAKTLDGKSFDGKTLAGKPAVLWFWAPWCPVCNREAPAIAKAAATHGDQVTFVGVAAQDQLAAMQDFAAKHRIDAFTNLNDEKAAIWAKFGVTYQPAFAFISADGKVEVVKDTMSAAELSGKLEALAG